MATISQYALLAGAAYESSRDDVNRFPVPTGWTAMRHEALPSGFEATTFVSGTGELVISFAGTNNPSDWAANFGLATGFSVDQLKEAAAYYLSIVNTVAGGNPGANIAFTGHSLGGGLAALLGVFFNKKAVTFDQAPFANAATTAVRDDLVSYLTTHGYTSTQLNALAPDLASFTGLDQRAGTLTRPAPRTACSTRRPPPKSAVAARRRTGHGRWRHEAQCRKYSLSAWGGLMRRWVRTELHGTGG